MTASILLRIGALDSKNDYTKNHSKVKHKFEKCAILCRLSLSAKELLSSDALIFYAETEARQ